MTGVPLLLFRFLWASIENKLVVEKIDSPHTGTLSTDSLVVKSWSVPDLLFIIT